MDKLSVRVNAKINLNLFITGRKDGLHTLDSLMHSVSLYDVVSISTTGTGVYMDGVLDENNCLNKVLELMQECGLPPVRFDIQKGIPIEGGLGGSSADLAGAVYLVRELFGVELPAIKLGSDVPFMIEGGMARVQGVGDRTEKLDPVELYLVIAKGKGGVSTKECYQRFDEIGKSSIPTTELLLDGLKEKDFAKISQYLANDMQKVAYTINPDVERVYNALKGSTSCVLMSGSGSSVFGIYPNEKEAIEGARKLKDQIEFVRVCKTEKYGVVKIDN